MGEREGWAGNDGKRRLGLLGERGQIAAARVIRYKKTEMADREILDLGNGGWRK